MWRCNHVLRIVDRIIQRRNLPTVRCMYSTYKSPRSNTTTRKNIPTSLHMSKTHTDTYVRTRNPINPSLNPPHSIPIQKPTIPTTPNPPLHVIPPNPISNSSPNHRPPNTQYASQRILPRPPTAPEPSLAHPPRTPPSQNSNTLARHGNQRDTVDTHCRIRSFGFGRWGGVVFVVGTSVVLFGSVVGDRIGIYMERRCALLRF